MHLRVIYSCTSNSCKIRIIRRGWSHVETYFFFYSDFNVVGWLFLFNFYVFVVVWTIIVIFLISSIYKSLLIVVVFVSIIIVFSSTWLLSFVIKVVWSSLQCFGFLIAFIRHFASFIRITWIIPSLSFVLIVILISIFRFLVVIFIISSLVYWLGVRVSIVITIRFVIVSRFLIWSVLVNTLFLITTWIVYLMIISNRWVSRFLIVSSVFLVCVIPIVILRWGTFFITSGVRTSGAFWCRTTSWFLHSMSWFRPGFRITVLWSHFLIISFVQVLIIKLHNRHFIKVIIAVNLVPFLLILPVSLLNSFFRFRTQHIATSISFVFMNVFIPIFIIKLWLVCELIWVSLRTLVMISIILIGSLTWPIDTIRIILVGKVIVVPSHRITLISASIGTHFLFVSYLKLIN